MKNKLMTIALTFCIALVLNSCSSDSNPAPPDPDDDGGQNVVGPLHLLDIGPKDMVLDPWWDEGSLTVKGYDAGDREITNLGVTWSSTVDSIAEINEDGKLTSHHFGSVWIKAVSGSIIDSVEVKVQQGNSSCQAPEEFPNPMAVNPPVTWFVQEVDTKFHSSNPDAEMTIWDALGTALDFDQDGDIDLMMAHRDNFTPNTDVVKVWLNEGNGNFIDGTEEIFPQGPPPVNNTRIRAIADVNGDGLQDVVGFQHGYDPGGVNGLGCGVVTCPGAPNLLLIQQPGGGLVDMAPTSVVPYDQKGFTHAGDVADIDCDGDIDIFEGQWGNGDATDPTRILINDGTGNFTQAEGRLPDLVLQGGIVGAAFGDLDRDGDADLIISLGINGETETLVLVNNGFGHFRRIPGDLRPIDPQIDGQSDGYSNIEIGDVDLDGWPDVILPSHGENNITALMLNNGDMTFTDVTGTNIPIESIGSQNGIRSLADLNGDGWLDYIGDWGSNAIYWNTGNGMFTKVELPVNTAGTMITPGDFNGDGKIDLHLDYGWDGEGDEGFNQILWNQ